MTCNDCIFEPLCILRISHSMGEDEVTGEQITNMEKRCRYFKNKSGYKEVKRGHWLIKQDDYDCEYMKCSVCKNEFYPVDEDTVDTTPNYCPSCGANMKEVKI